MGNTGPEGTVPRAAPGGAGGRLRRPGGDAGEGRAGERVIGVDLGGTKILAGLVDRGGAVERHRETPTPLGSQAELLAALDDAVASLRDERVVALGFGLPSQIDQRTGIIRGSVNIPLDELDFRTRMSERFGTRRRSRSTSPARAAACAACSCSPSAPGAAAALCSTASSTAGGPSSGTS